MPMSNIRSLKSTTPFTERQKREQLALVPQARSHYQDIPRTGVNGLGLGSKRPKRHRKILRDNINGITKGSIRRMARRGGVRRISKDVYEEIRGVLKLRLELILKHVTLIVENRNQRTVTTSDIVFTLSKLGSPVYGFGVGNVHSGRA